AGRTVVRAPFAGVVVQRHHNPGDVVEAASGDPVLRLVDPRRVEVVAAVPLADVTRVKTGAEGRLPSQEGVTLRVVTRPAAVDAASGTAPVRLAFKGALAGLPVGLPVPVDIDAEVRTGVLTVPV